MRTCIEICADCPKLPKGVEKAVVTAIEPPDIHKIAGTALGHAFPELIRDAERSINVTVTAVEVKENSGLDEGDVAYLTVDGAQSSEEDVARAFEQCPGRKQNLIQKMLGTWSCGAIRD